MSAAVRAIIMIVVGLLLISGAARADWEEELARQLKDDRGCEATAIRDAVVRYEDGREAVEAVAECADGRRFIAARDRAPRRFQLRPCDLEAPCIDLRRRAPAQP